MVHQPLHFLYQIDRRFMKKCPFIPQYFSFRFLDSPISLCIFLNSNNVDPLTNSTGNQIDDIDVNCTDMKHFTIYQNDLKYNYIWWLLISFLKYSFDPFSLLCFFFWNVNFNDKFTSQKFHEFSKNVNISLEVIYIFLCVLMECSIYLSYKFFFEWNIIVFLFLLTVFIPRE